MKAKFRIRSMEGSSMEPTKFTFHAAMELPKKFLQRMDTIEKMEAFIEWCFNAGVTKFEEEGVVIDGKKISAATAMALAGEQLSIPERADVGTEEGDICNRNGCQGRLIMENPNGGSCSCHLNPPCSFCMEALPTCPVCHWQEEEQ